VLLQRRALQRDTLRMMRLLIWLLGVPACLGLLAGIDAGERDGRVVQESSSVRQTVPAEQNVHDVSRAVVGKGNAFR